MIFKKLSCFVLIVTYLFIGGCGVKGPTPIAPEGMVLIPTGEFQMGSVTSEGSPNELPVHIVSIDAFYMDKYEVTNAQYKQFVDANPQWQKDHIDKSLHDGTYLALWNGNDYPSGKANHPVVYVSWYAAVAYAQWAGKRLPTEAEWEYAARGGLSGKKYPWGNDLDSSKANYNYNAGDTTPVGAYLPNGYGLYDIAGNVWEWCLDEYNEDFYARSPRENPLSGAVTIGWIMDNFTNVETHRVLRSASWLSYPEALPVSFRSGEVPTNANDVIGLRCVKAQ